MHHAWSRGALRARVLVELRTNEEFATVQVDHDAVADALVDSGELAGRIHPEVRDIMRERATVGRNAADSALIVIVAATLVTAIAARRSPWLTELGPLTLTVILVLLLVVAASAAFRIYGRRSRARQAERRFEERLRTEVPVLLRPAINRLEQDERPFQDAKFDVTAAPALLDPAGHTAVPTAAHGSTRELVGGADSSTIAIVGRRGSGRTTLVNQVLSDARLGVLGARVETPRAPADLVWRIYEGLLKSADANAQVGPGRFGRRRLRRLLGDERRRLEYKGRQGRILNVQLDLPMIRVAGGGNADREERERTPAAWLDRLRDFLTDLHRHTGQRIVLGIELDEAIGAEAVAETIGMLRYLGRTRGVHVVFTARAELLAAQDPAGHPVAELVETAFESVVRIPPLSLPGTVALLAGRTTGVPRPVAMFCHAWGGGNPHDVVAAALACVEQRGLAGRPLTGSEVVDRVLVATLRRIVATAIDGRRDPAVLKWLFDARAKLDGAEQALPANLPEAPDDTLASTFAVAGRISAFFRVPRDANGWRDPRTARCVELLANARAAAGQSTDEVRRHLDRLAELEEPQ